VHVLLRLDADRKAFVIVCLSPWRVSQSEKQAKPVTSDPLTDTKIDVLIEGIIVS
jgi:hypothetical protein